MSEGSAPPARSIRTVALDQYHLRVARDKAKADARDDERALDLRGHLERAVTDLIGLLAPDDLAERIVANATTASVTLDGIIFELHTDTRTGAPGPMYAVHKKVLGYPLTLSDLGAIIDGHPVYPPPAAEDPVPDPWAPINRVLDANDELDAALEAARLVRRRDHT